jgi:hypothetical protein
MDRFFKVLRYCLVAGLVVLCLQAAAGLVIPPYSDEEIRSSWVDTWEVHAWWTILVVGFSALVAALGLPLAVWGRELATRRFARLVVALCVAAAILAVASHATLTSRTTRLTGQTFSRFYGLF